MDREIVFTVKWLNERFPFDSAARNKTVEKQVKKRFKAKTALQIVDIGAGSGNNFKHLSLCFDQDQHWTLVEHDPRLCKASILLLADHGRMLGYDVSQNEFSLSMLRGKQKITVKTLQADLLDLDKTLDLEAVDLVTASAVFDLFSVRQFSNFVQKIFNAKSSFLAILNYTGMSFSPKRKHDKQMVDLYEKHMLRPQEFGQGMGPNCGRDMLAHLEDIKAVAASGKSVWKIGPKDTSMLSQLLGFMEEAIPELDLTTEERAHFDEWLEEKREMIKAETLSIQVKHLDLFGATS